MKTLLRGQDVCPRCGCDDISHPCTCYSYLDPSPWVNTHCDQIRIEHPYRGRWEMFKISCTEFLAKYLGIHIDWYWP